MSKKILTKGIAEQFLKREHFVDLSYFRSIEDAAAQALVQDEGGILDLSGLTSLSDAAAQHLAQYNGATLALDKAFKKRLVALRTKQVQAKIKSGTLKTPAEWQNGRIIPANKPAKPLKGHGFEREDTSRVKWWLPKKVLSWFVQKLDDAHKTSVSGDGFGAGKSAHISPEAAELLREKADAWLWLMESEAKGAKEQEAASLKSLATAKPPKQFKDGKVSLPAPKEPVAIACRWKPDFEGGDYQSVLHYYSYLPSEHVGSITDPNGYPAKTMSPEAADLYRQHRAFWEAKHAESKSQAKAASKVRKQEAELRVEKAAKTAGLSREELETKLDRLSELVTQGNLKLAADMIAGFGEPWLYEALLAGASITLEGDLKPGKVLKCFKEQAKFIMLLAVAYMPEGVAVDPSVHREALVNMKVTHANVDVVAEMVASRLTGLQPHMMEMSSLEKLLLPTADFLVRHVKDVDLSGLKTLGIRESMSLSKLEGNLRLDGLNQVDTGVADALAKINGELSFRGLSSITESAARALGCHVGGLTVGLKDLPAPIASALAATRGDLELSGLMTISSEAAAALEAHAGKLTLGISFGWYSDNSFELNAESARHLARHAGPLSLPQLKQIDADASMALSELKHYIELHDIQGFPDGVSGVRLCEKMAMSPNDYLRFSFKKSPQPECAAALAKFNGKLSIGVFPGALVVKQWEDDALIALAAHQGELEVNPEHISDAVGRALGQRGVKSKLVIFYGEVSIADAAAEALSLYQGELIMDGIEMSKEAAAHLVKRRSMGLYRSKLKPAVRKVFESAGSWTDSTWTRKT